MRSTRNREWTAPITCETHGCELYGLRINEVEGRGLDQYELLAQSYGRGGEDPNVDLCPACGKLGLLHSKHPTIMAMPRVLAPGVFAVVDVADEDYLDNGSWHNCRIVTMRWTYREAFTTLGWLISKHAAGLREWGRSFDLAVGVNRNLVRPLNWSIVRAEG